MATFVVWRWGQNELTSRSNVPVINESCFKIIDGMSGIHVDGIDGIYMEYMAKWNRWNRWNKWNIL